MLLASTLPTSISIRNNSISEMAPFQAQSQHLHPKPPPLRRLTEPLITVPPLPGSTSDYLAHTTAPGYHRNFSLSSTDPLLRMPSSGHIPTATHGAPPALASQNAPGTGHGSSHPPNLPLAAGRHPNLYPTLPAINKPNSSPIQHHRGPSTRPPPGPPYAPMGSYSGPLADSYFTPPTHYGHHGAPQGLPPPSLSPYGPPPVLAPPHQQPVIYSTYPIYAPDYQYPAAAAAGPAPPHHAYGQYANYGTAPYELNNALLNKRRIIKRRTRTGCLTCRKRRIKCDERKPHCYNCERSKKLCLGYESLSTKYGTGNKSADDDESPQDEKDEVKKEDEPRSRKSSVYDLIK